MAPQAEIKVLSTTAMKMVFEEVTPGFERQTGSRLAIELGPSLRQETRLGNGEAADAAIITRAGAEALLAGGKIAAGSLVDVARSSIGICVAKGAPHPDICSAEAFKRTMLAAKSVALSKPVGGGASGAHMAKVFALLGIAEAMQAKSLYGAGGPAALAGLAVLRGEAEIGIQQIPELMAVSGIDIVGPLPEKLQGVTLFIGAIPVSARHAEAGRALLRFLTTPQVRNVIKSKGLDPA